MRPIPGPSSCAAITINGTFKSTARNQTIKRFQMAWRSQVISDLGKTWARLLEENPASLA